MKYYRKFGLKTSPFRATLC